MANGSVKKDIKKTTLSGTTGGAGQRYINVSDYPNVINVVCKTNGYAALLYAPVSSDTLWFVLFLNQSLSPAANVSVTYDVYYL